MDKINGIPGMCDGKCDGCNGCDEVRESATKVTPRNLDGKTCNFCGATFKRFRVDGKTIHGYWADMCLTCFENIGEGLGTGRGQLYQYDYAGKEWRKVAG